MEMKVDISKAINIGCDDESAVHLLTASVDLPQGYSFGQLRRAYRTLEYEKSEMFIEYDQKDWSPTGQTYTTDLKVIAKQLHYGTLTFVIVHKTTVDC